MRAHLATVGCNGQEILRAHLAAIGCNGLSIQQSICSYLHSIMNLLNFSSTDCDFANPKALDT